MNRLKRGELAYKILIKPDGVAYGCKHFSLDDPACQCTSTSCSATENGQDFCGCEKFLNPLLKPKPPKPEKPAKPRKKKALAEPVAAPRAVAATDSASETVPAKPRKPRAARKKKPAAVTGDLFPPPPRDGRVLDLLSENPE